MSQANAELAYRTIDAINRRDLAAYLALADDDIEAISRPRGEALEAAGLSEQDAHADS